LTGCQDALLLDVVSQSPKHVGTHDRAAWLELFTDDAAIEDPVGTAPADKSSGLLGRFWDTFIAPHEIRFEIAADYIAGQDVFRDAVIRTKVASGVEVTVPAYLLYQLVDDGGRLRVRRMTAHWNLASLSLGALKRPRAWGPMTLLFVRMIRLLGFAWVGRYLRAFGGGIGRKGHRALAALVDSVRQRDASHLGRLLSGAEVDFSGERLSPSELLAKVPAGTTLETESEVIGGRRVSFRFRLGALGGLGLIEFGADDRIARVRFFHHRYGTSALRSAG
jgi:hypothetical protein